jgi:hypothetical protein
MIELAPLEAVTCMHEVTLTYPVSETSPKFQIGDIQIIWNRQDAPGAKEWFTSHVPIPETFLLQNSIVIGVGNFCL